MVKKMAVVNGGVDHSSKANRVEVGGECVGYYSVLLGYDESTDTFCTGWNQQIPAEWVDKIALYDIISELIKIVEYIIKPA